MTKLLRTTSPERVDATEFSISTIKSEYSHNKNAQAYLLKKFHHFTREEMFALGTTSDSSIWRAGVAVESGFDPGRTGRHQKLNDQTEQILVNWILRLCRADVTVYTSDVLQYVCSVYILLFLIFFRENI